MPVSGNEEQPGILSRPLLDMYAGIPLKKRRLLLVPPPSPPRHEAQSSPSKETDDEKKIDEAQSSPCIETDNVKKIDGSCSDVKNEESLSDLKIPEQSDPVWTSIPESVPSVKKIEGNNGSECLNPEESASDLKNKHVIDSDQIQRPLSSNNTPDMSEVQPVDNIEVEKKYLLTEENAAPDVPLNTVGFPLTGDKGKIHFKQELMVQNNEGSSPDTSRLSFSLSKVMVSMDTKATDGGVGKGNGKGKDDFSPTRMNWDLNTPMDSWDGPDGNDVSVPDNIPQFLNSADSGSIFINKGKQPIGTEEHTSIHSSPLIASILGNHELEDSLRLTLGVAASQEMEMDKGLSSEIASRKYVSGNATISTTSSAGSIGCGIVKSEPFGDNSKKTNVSSLKRESTEKPDKKPPGLSISITEKLSGQTSIKAEPVMEDKHELHRVETGRFHYVGSSSSLLAPLLPLKSSSELSASVGVSNQSEFTFRTNNIQVSNCSSVLQPTAKVNESAQNFIETQASDDKFSNDSEISQLKINKNHNNTPVNGEGSVIDEEKLNISIETTEYECYNSDCESDENQGFAIRFDTQGISVREEDDFEDGEVREAQAHLHTKDAIMETLGIKLINSDANSSVSNEIGNNMSGNPGDNIEEHVDTVSFDDLTNQDGPPHLEENAIITCKKSMESNDEATNDNVGSDGIGNSNNNKVDSSSPSKVDGVYIESTNGSNKSRIITLPRTSVTTSHFESGSMSCRSGGGREREETGFDGRHGFVRERFQEPRFRNPRNNYMRGRGGRFAGHTENPRVEWDSEREFSDDLHRFNRNKCSAYNNDMEIKPSNFPLDNNNSNRGRKPFNRPFSRRDDPPIRDMQMLNKVSRNASPSGGRRNNNVEARNDIFSRPLRSNDTIISSRSNSGYEDLDGQFVRGTRNNFSSSSSTGQNRFFSRARSKSPIIGSRTHSPGGGPWSPRRRSPDRFKRRPAALYGPDRSSFPEDIVDRRRGGGSPSYVGPGRATNDPDLHPRPFNSSRRSPSDRVFNRNSARLDVVGGGARIRGCNNNNDFFNRPPSGGFREVNGGEGSSDDNRRKCGERNQSFRSLYNAAAAENDNRSSFHVNDGSRTFRFRSDSDTDYNTGRNMGEDREFDERIKNRPTVPPRRMNY